MKLVILGAGASYDSIYLDAIDKNSDRYKGRINWRPPMGKDLFGYRDEFDEIFSKYPGAESFRSVINSCLDIEDFFQQQYDLSQDVDGANIKLRIINTQFYLQHLFLEISKRYESFAPSNYDTLVQYAYNCRKPVMFVSFNYDTLIEKSIQRICNANFESFSTYVDHRIKLIKPHGSCNWVKPINGNGENVLEGVNPSKLSNYLYNPANIDVTLRLVESVDHRFFIMKDREFEDLKKKGKMHLLPQLLIPLKKKDDFILPLKQKETLVKNLPSVKEILIIGWKVNEQNFNDLLSQTLRNKGIKVTYVCGDDSVEIESRLRRILGHDISITRYAKHERNEEGNMVQRSTFSSFVRNSLCSDFFDITRV